MEILRNDLLNNLKSCKLPKWRIIGNAVCCLPTSSVEPQDQVDDNKTDTITESEYRGQTKSEILPNSTDSQINQTKFAAAVVVAKIIDEDQATKVNLRRELPKTSTHNHSSPNATNGPTLVPNNARPTIPNKGYTTLPNHGSNNVSFNDKYENEPVAAAKTTQTKPIGYQTAVGQHPLHSELELVVHTRLYPPGTVIHVVRNHPPDKMSKHRCKRREPLHQAIFASNKDFGEVLISPTMLSDHLIPQMIHAMNMVLTQQSPDKPIRTMATAYAQNGGPISTTAPVATIVTAAVDTPVTILPATGSFRRPAPTPAYKNQAPLASVETLTFSDIADIESRLSFSAESPDGRCKDNSEYSDSPIVDLNGDDISQPLLSEMTASSSFSLQRV